MALTDPGRRVADRNPYLFLVGCPRSGTTLLQRMLDHHPQLAVANDTHFIPAAIDGMEPALDLPVTPAIVERVRSFRTRAGKGFDRLGLPPDTLDRAAASARTYSELVSALYREYAQQNRKPLAGEKTPDYVRHLPLLRGLFPWTKVVHLIRDGRDVTLALRDWSQDGKGPGRLKLWRENPTAACALWWEWQVGAGRRDAGVFGRAYNEIRYERLVATPEWALRDLADFLELPFDARMLTYHQGRTRTKPGLPTNKAWLPPTPGIRSWQAQMPPPDVELVEALVGDLLDELGYKRAFPTISRAILDRAGRYREWWARKLARRSQRAAVKEQR